MNFARKTGAALWDRIVDDFAGRILLVGRPMSLDELLLEIPQRTRDFASLAFQKFNTKALGHKLDQRIEGEKYGLFRTADGMYCVIPLSPDYRQDVNAEDAA